MTDRSIDPRAARLTGNQCHCPDCDQYFTTVRNFDRHLKGTARPECLPPGSVGLVQDRFGYWQSPPSETPVFHAMKREQQAELFAMGVEP